VNSREGRVPRDRLPKDSAPRDWLPKDSAPRDWLPEDSAPRGLPPKDSAPLRALDLHLNKNNVTINGNLQCKGNSLEAKINDFNFAEKLAT